MNDETLINNNKQVATDNINSWKNDYFSWYILDSTIHLHLDQYWVEDSSI